MRRWLPLALILAGAVLGIVFLRDWLSFQALAEHRETLLAWRDANPLTAPALFILAYVLVVAFSIPGAIWVTLTGGFLFGLFPGALYNVTGSTLGAVALFLAVRAGLGERLQARIDASDGRVKRISDGIRENEVPMLLSMRLIPALPFFVANLIPAFLGVGVWRFAWTTFVGIIPGGLIYTSVGAGLGEVFARGEQPDLGIIFTPSVLLPLLGLAALSLLPIVLKRFRSA
ncbi:MAG: TVP38/TMEM64 family protein [Pararhodobacter sp.]